MVQITCNNGFIFKSGEKLLLHSTDQYPRPWFKSYTDKSAINHQIIKLDSIAYLIDDISAIYHDHDIILITTTDGDVYMRGKLFRRTFKKWTRIGFVEPIKYIGGKSNSRIIVDTGGKLWIWNEILHLVDDDTYYFDAGTCVRYRSTVSNDNENDVFVTDIDFNNKVVLTIDRNVVNYNTSSAFYERRFDYFSKITSMSSYADTTSFLDEDGVLHWRSPFIHTYSIEDIQAITHHVLVKGATFFLSENILYCKNLLLPSSAPSQSVKYWSDDTEIITLMNCGNGVAVACDDGFVYVITHKNDCKLRHKIKTDHDFSNCPRSAVKSANKNLTISTS